VNCDNCGAPMTLVRDRDYFVCEYCGNFYFPQAAQDGVRVLGAPAETNCPVCALPLVSAAVDGMPILACPKCRGRLIKQGVFVYVVKYLRAQVSPLETEPPLNADELRQQRRCPGCGQMMDTHPYYGGGNAVVDTCEHCGWIWLDYGELNKIAQAPESDYGHGGEAAT